MARRRKAPKPTVNLYRRGLISSKPDRRLLHELLVPAVIAPIRTGANALDWYTRTKQDGLTEGEQKLLKQAVIELRGITRKLDQVYFRLKFL